MFVHKSHGALRRCAAHGGRAPRCARASSNHAHASSRCRGVRSQATREGHQVGDLSRRGSQAGHRARGCVLECRWPRVRRVVADEAGAHRSWASTGNGRIRYRSHQFRLRRRQASSLRRVVAHCEPYVRAQGQQRQFKAEASVRSTCRSTDSRVVLTSLLVLARTSPSSLTPCAPQAQNQVAFTALCAQ
jgi:hypothetical protein